MAARQIATNLLGKPVYYGSAADLAAATAVIDAGAEFYVGNDKYESNGAGGWNQISTGGADHVETQPGSVNAYGPHPATYFNDGDLAGSVTGVAIGTTIAEVTDATGINAAVFAVTALTGTGGAVAAYGCIDGTNYEPNRLRLLDLSAGTEMTTVTAVGGPHAIKLGANGAKFKKIKLVYEASSGTGNATTRGATSWVG